MAISLNAMYNQINYALARNSSALTILQEQAATGERIIRISDDPTDAYRVLNLNSETTSLKNYASNIASVTDSLDTASSIILEIQQNVTKAISEVTKIITGTYDEEGGSRTISAKAINDILEQVVSLANTKTSNQYIFSGSNTDTAPYSVERDEKGDITRVNYQGSQNSRVVEVAPNVKSETILVGDEIFKGNHYNQPIFYGSTGATAGSGTSSVTGDVWLEVKNDGTNYQLSIDNGSTWTTVPAGGEENTAVTNGETGEVLFVNTKNLTSTGLEPVRVEGTYDVFNTLVTVRDMLKNTKNLGEADLQEVRELMVSSLEEITVTLSSADSSVGGKINSLNDLQTVMEDLSAKSQEQSDTLSEADAAQIAIDLSKHETLYEMTLQVAAKLLSMNFLDFIS